MRVNSLDKLTLEDFEDLDDTILTDDIGTDAIKKEVLSRLSPDAKELVVRESIRRVIRKYGEDGLTIDEIVELTGHSRSAVKKHLDSLCALREVYCLKKNKKLTLYYPNGKPLHTVGKKRLEWESDWKNNPIFEITVNMGPKDRLFLHIIEKKFTILEGETAEGAIMVPLDHLDDFIEALKELKKEVEGLKYV